MRRVIPLLCILLLLCGCGGGQSVSAPDEAARLVIFTARSAAVSGRAAVSGCCCAC